jgi:FlaA1/EpsC-like NDP-sugar epimerase
MLIQKTAHLMVSLPRPLKRIVAVAVDGLLCVLSVWMAFNLRYDSLTSWSAMHAIASFVSFALAVTIFTSYGLYRAIFRYAGLPALLAVFKAIVVYGLLYMLILTVISVPGIPRSVGLLQPLLLLIAITLSRVWARVWLGGVYQGLLHRSSLPKVLIYGAGSAGRQLAAALKTSPELVVVGLLDDDERLHGQVLNGLKIYNPSKLLDVVRKLQVNQVFLAIPSVTRARRNEILDLVRAAHVQVRTLPGVMDLAQGRVHVSDVQDLDVEDLLGRDPVAPNPLMMGKNIANKVVMVTGAGGSIGSELCRQIVKASPSALLLVELTEFALYAIHNELEQALAKDGQVSTKLVPLLANVRDEQRMSEIIGTWKPSTIYHAAAYKHVPLVEHNPAEGIKNNVLGTMVTAAQALQHGVSDFVLVSTDKAVRPTNIMGASKRLAEMVLQAQADALLPGNKTRFSMVRFGNVLGSSGSVVPLFRRQIKDGGPITLTDERITRYFMTIPEAAQLVIQAGAMANGGDVFVLDMGEPVKIMDLARRMVELSGLSVRNDDNPEGDIEIAVTGLRPGEKLYEELLIGDNPLPTSHKRIMKAHEEFVPWALLQIKLSELNHALDGNDVPLIRSLLKGLVPGYQPDGEVVDWVWMENEKSA